ncbi:hypothetical protein OROGR_027411 [Orobanche gracilis]
MAHDKNLKKPEGLCQKLHNAVMNPFRARIRRTSQNTPPMPVRAEFEPPTEVEIVGRREEIAKSYTKKEKLSQPKNGDDLLHEKNFSGCVGKVKDKVTKTASSVGGSGGGGGGGRETSLMRDSFNDRITNYINHGKIRMRKTTSIGDDDDDDDDRSSSLK